MLIASVDIANTTDSCFAFCCHCRQNHSRTCTQVCCCYFCAMEVFDAVDRCFSAFDIHVCTQFTQFIHVLITIFPYVFCQDACAVAHCQQCGNLRLQVCRETGVSHCFYIDCFQRFIRHNTDGIFPFRNFYIHFIQLCCQRIHVFGNDIFYQHIAACDRCCDHVCTSFDLVRDDCVLCAFQFRYTFDTDHVCTGTLDICTHHVQIVCCIYNVGFFCCVFNCCCAFCHSSSQHYVDCCAYAHLVHVNRCTNQFFCISFNHAIFFDDCCTQRTETFQVQVDRSFAEVTATGHGNFCFFVTTQQCTDQVIRSAHFGYAFKIRFVVHTFVTVDFQCVFINKSAFAAHFFDGVADISNIFDCRQVFQNADTSCHNCCRDHCYSRIFCAAYSYFTFQSFTAFYNEFIHKNIHPSNFPKGQSISRKLRKSPPFLKK